MKIAKMISALLVSAMLIFPTTVFASDIGWPVDTQEVQADVNTGLDGTIEVQAETIPQSGTQNLSAIDNTTTGVQDYVVFGEDYELVNRLTASDPNKVNSLDKTVQIYSNYSEVVPTVSTDQMVSWILKKGNEIISILQIFAQPFAIVIFIVSCAICLIGSLTKGNMAGKGLTGMIASAILYAAVLYAPMLVNTIVNFVTG